MKRIFSLALFALLSHLLSGQVDYSEFKKRFPLTCTRLDSASVIQSQMLLDSLNRFEITGGRMMFFNDIGMTYYVRYGKWNDKNDLIKSLGYFEKGFSEFENSTFAWQLTLYSRLGECDKALQYLEKHLVLAKAENIEINYEQVYYVQQRCCK